MSQVARGFDDGHGGESLPVILDSVSKAGQLLVKNSLLIPKINQQLESLSYRRGLDDLATILCGIGTYRVCSNNFI
jgi:hypothetical protein